MAITYHEVHDTFNALAKTKTYLDEKWGDIESFMHGKSRFVFIGCGSSYSIAKSMSAICGMGTGKPSAAMAAGDIVLHAARYKKSVDGAAVVFISRSGRTSELIRALDALESLGCRLNVASLVCADDTPLGEKSELVLSTPWAFDESVCQTRCVTNFYFMSAYIAAGIAGDQAVSDDLQHILASGYEYLAQAEALAKELSGQSWTHAVVLADAELEGIAEEGSLVFKEVCQLPSNYYHMLDVRHGPMVLIGKDTLVIAALGVSNELEYDLVRDLKEKGALVVVFSDVPAEIDGVLTICFGRTLSHISKGIPLIVLCQLISYYKSIVTGADPDKPIGLDPWIAL